MKQQNFFLELLVAIILFVALAFYLYFIWKFSIENYLWIFPAYLYILFFVVRDFAGKKKKLREKLKPKKRDERRIDFWH